MRPNLIVAVVWMMCIVQTLAAQNPNPFELLWRKDTVGSTARVAPSKSETSKTVIPASAVTTPEINPVDTHKMRATTDTAEHSTAVIKGDSLRHTDSLGLAEEKTTTEEKTDAIVIPPVISSQPAPKETPLVFVLLFGVAFSLLAWGMSLNRELLQKIYRAALNENLSALLYREQRFATTQYLYYTIYVIFFLNGGMFMYFLGHEFGWTAWIFQSVWSCIGLVTVVYLLRHLSLSILGSTYPMTKETSHFSFSILLHNILLGVGLIPANLFLAFGPDGMYRAIAVSGIVLCGLVYLMRQFRGLLISGSMIGTNPFRFFIYLCAVEILPLFTLVKFFHN